MVTIPCAASPTGSFAGSRRRGKGGYGIVVETIVILGKT